MRKHDRQGDEFSIWNVPKISKKRHKDLSINGTGKWKISQKNKLQMTNYWKIRFSWS